MHSVRLHVRTCGDRYTDYLANSHTWEWAIMLFSPSQGVNVNGATACEASGGGVTANEVTANEVTVNGLTVNGITANRVTVNRPAA